MGVLAMSAGDRQGRPYGGVITTVVGGGALDAPHDDHRTYYTAYL